MPLKVSVYRFTVRSCSPGRPGASRRALGGITVGALAFPIVANFDAAPNAESSRVKGLLVRQVDSAVRWDESVRAMAAQGVTHALEIGPGKVLANLMKRIAKEIKVLSVHDAASLAQVPSFLADAA